VQPDAQEKGNQMMRKEATDAKEYVEEEGNQVRRKKATRC
jgi:hypothetical protein